MFYAICYDLKFEYFEGILSLFVAVSLSSIINVEAHNLYEIHIESLLFSLHSYLIVDFCVMQLHQLVVIQNKKKNWFISILYHYTFHINFN